MLTGSRLTPLVPCDVTSGQPEAALAALDFGRDTVRSEYDAKHRAVWLHLAPRPRPCFTHQLLDDILDAEHAVRAVGEHIDFLVAASDLPGVFNLGGDLQLFQRLAEARDAEGLLRYAEKCVRAVHNAASGFGHGITSIALLEGDALGGGLEAALACQIVVAERGVKMGFPEILFNLVPGMGAYSLVTRRIGQRLAEKLILDGEVLPAERMFDLGLVDHLVEPGEGRDFVRRLIRQRSHAANGLRAFRKAQQCTPFALSYEELMDITREWVAAACKLEQRDLRMMDRLVKAQNRLVSADAPARAFAAALAA